jgi:hypothetical protein
MCSIPLWANTSSWYTLGPDHQATINVELFLSSTCPYCHKEDAFFKEIEPETPWLLVHRYFINEDKEALLRFNQLLTEQKFNDFAVPSAFFCNSRWLGFDSAMTTGKDLLKTLHYCKQQIEKKGSLTQATVDVIKRWANANMLNASVTEQPSTFHYLLFVALLDASNPCALFCFAVFLGLLFIQDDKKVQVKTALLFVLTVLAVHFLQQTQANMFFQILPWLRLFALLIGGGSLYMVFRSYNKQLIKPYEYYSWAFLLALIVYSYQQTCVMNWSFIFEQWLYNQPISSGQKTILQLIYQIFYSVPPLIVLILYWLLQLFGFFARMKPYLEVIGLLFIGIIALFLIIAPMAMAHYVSSFIILLAAAIVGIILNRYRGKNKNN